MKITDLKDKSIIVATHRDGYEVKMRVNWWELMGKFLLSYEGELTSVQYLVDTTFGTVAQITRFGSGANVESVPTSDYALDRMRPYVPGETLRAPKPAGRREPSLTEQLNERLSGAIALTYRGRRFERVGNGGAAHEYHYQTPDKLSKIVVHTHPEFVIEYKHREPVYETVEETLSNSPAEFLDDRHSVAFHLLTTG